MNKYNAFAEKCLREIAAGNDLNWSDIPIQQISLLKSIIVFNCEPFMDHYGDAGISDEDIQLLCIGGAEDTIEKFLHIPGFKTLDDVLNNIYEQLSYTRK